MTKPEKIFLLGLTGLQERSIRNLDWLDGQLRAEIAAESKEFGERTYAEYQRLAELDGELDDIVEVRKVLADLVRKLAEMYATAKQLDARLGDQSKSLYQLKRSLRTLYEQGDLSEATAVKLLYLLDGDVVPSSGRRIVN